ncbi:MAG: hypothetical protein BWZ01_02700 [Deltaproteobacteria bacterium ADurb.BinA179]|jgi:hypothetical protein|nr:MAG: hypothetical protein BWZ01_02700 [Deltaproteobacteria bacterium ADurb.BinA179]
MRTTIGRIGLVAAGLVATSAACNHFDKVTWEYSTVLPSHVLQFFDNGSLSNPAMWPLESSNDGFYLVSSHEMIDSLIEGDTSLLDSLLPSGGSLLIFCTSTCIEDELLGYSYEVSGDSVTVWVEINEWYGSDPCLPECDCYLFPFGVILQSAAQPESD